MLTTTRREIINDYDISQNRQTRNFAPADTMREPANGNYVSNESYARPADEYISRSQVARKLYGQDFDADEYEAPCAEDYAAPDLMPSLETMQAARFANHQPYMTERKETATVAVNSSTKTKMKFSTRSKILIASYAAVLLALVLIITLTTVSVASLFNSNDAVPNEPNGEFETVDALDDGIMQADVSYAAAQSGSYGATQGSAEQFVMIDSQNAPVILSF